MALYIINDIACVETESRELLIRGGACYIRTFGDAKDARKVINNSQGKETTVSKSKTKCHQKGHVSDPSKAKNKEGIDCVENYNMSKSGKKFGRSAVRDESVQAVLVDVVLTHPESVEAMNIY